MGAPLLGGMRGGVAPSENESTNRSVEGPLSITLYLMTQSTPSSPPGRRFRRLLSWLLGIGLVLLLLYPLLRDLPRRGVVHVLSQRMEAKVDLAALHIEGWQHLELEGLVITTPHILPEVEQVRIGRMVLEGPIRRMLRSELERLTLLGFEMDLRPAPVNEVLTPPFAFKIHRFELEDGVVRVTSAQGQETTTLRFETHFDHLVGGGDLPEFTSGALTARAAAAPILPLAQILRLEFSPEVYLHQLELTAVLSAGVETLDLRTAAIKGRLQQVPFELTDLELTAARDGEGFTSQFGLGTLQTQLADSPLHLESMSATLVAQPVDDALWSLELTPQMAGLEGAQLDATWAPGEDLWRTVRATAETVRWHELWPGLGLRGKGPITLEDDGSGLTASFALSPEEIHRPDLKLTTPGARLDVEAAFPRTINPETLVQGIELRRAELNLPSIAGSLGGEPLPALPALSVQVTSSPESPRRSQVEVRYGAARLELSGTTPWTLEAPWNLRWTLNDPQPSQLLDLARRPPLEFPVPEVELGGALRGRGQLEGLPTAPQLTASLELDRLSGGPLPTSLEDLVMEGSTRWPGTSARLSRFTARGTLELDSVAPLPFTLASSARLDGAAVEDLDVRVVLLAGPEGHLKGRLPADGPFTATLTVPPLPLGWALPFVPDLADLPFKPTGTLGAAFDLDFDWGQGDLKQGTWHLRGPLRLEGGGFTSPNDNREMQDLSGTLELAAKGTGFLPNEVTLKGQLGGALVLWDTLFVDLSDLRFPLDVQLRAGESLDQLTLDASLDVPGSLRLEGGAALGQGPATPYTSTVTLTDLGAFTNLWLPRFAPDLPLTLAGSLDLQLQGELAPPNRGTAQGAFHLDVPHLDRESLEVRDLKIEIPLDLVFDDGRLNGPRRLGRLSVGALRVLEAELPPVDSALWVEGDDAGLVESLDLPVFGGRLLLDDPAAHDLSSPDARAAAGLRLQGLSLARLADELGLPPLDGTLEGDFRRAILRGGELLIEGGGQVQIFGGEVVLEDLAGKDLFTPYPEIFFSAQMRDIDLGLLTRRIDFGEMTGLLQGSVSDCRLFKGIPVTCQATVRGGGERGTRRTVDIKAVNNLTILGTGQSTSAMDRGVQRFLNRFTYAAFGVDIHLADDVLRLRGLERRGDRELFLRGRLPFPIDVVNAQPGGVVSFQAMLRRLSSLDFSKVQTRTQ